MQGFNEILSIFDKSESNMSSFLYNKHEFSYADSKDSTTS